MTSSEYRCRFQQPVVAANSNDWQRTLVAASDRQKMNYKRECSAYKKEKLKLKKIIYDFKKEKTIL